MLNTTFNTTKTKKMRIIKKKKKVKKKVAKERLDDEMQHLELPPRPVTISECQTIQAASEKNRKNDFDIASQHSK